MSIDYRSLIADRKQKQTRPIVRHPVCLIPELYADREEAAEALNEAELAEMDDERGGGQVASAGLQSAREALADVDARIAEATITAVFKAPLSRRQGEQTDDLTAQLEASPERTNAIVVDHAKACLLEAFDHFEGPGKVKLDLNETDLRELLEQMAQGETLAIHRKLARASTVDAELPSSVRRLLGAQHSAETSK